jgi:hypothetical protein
VTHQGLATVSLPSGSSPTFSRRSSPALVSAAFGCARVWRNRYNDIASWHYANCRTRSVAETGRLLRTTTCAELDKSMESAAGSNVGTYIEVVTDACAASPLSMKPHEAMKTLSTTREVTAAHTTTRQRVSDHTAGSTLFEMLAEASRHLRKRCRASCARSEGLESHRYGITTLSATKVEFGFPETARGNNIQLGAWRFCSLQA